MVQHPICKRNLLAFRLKKVEKNKSLRNRAICNLSICWLILPLENRYSEDKFDDQKTRGITFLYSADHWQIPLSAVQKHSLAQQTRFIIALSFASLTKQI